MLVEHTNPVFQCETKFSGTLAFARQAIVSTIDLIPFGYEYLFRGQTRPATSIGWLRIDQALVHYLSQEAECTGSACFVNLSHESLLAIPDTVFINATERNDIRFEVNEAVAEEGLFERVCEKVNRLSALGVQFVIDDFGAGLDGTRRLYSLDRVCAVKIDRDLLISASRRPRAAGMLHATVAHWNSIGVMTIAEGVETRELLDFSVKMGFALAQGFHVDVFRPTSLVKI